MKHSFYAKHTQNNLYTSIIPQINDFVNNSRMKAVQTVFSLGEALLLIERDKKNAVSTAFNSNLAEGGRFELPLQVSPD